MKSVTEEAEKLENQLRLITQGHDADLALTSMLIVSYELFMRSTSPSKTSFIFETFARRMADELNALEQIRKN